MHCLYKCLSLFAALLCISGALDSGCVYYGDELLDTLVMIAGQNVDYVMLLIYDIYMITHWWLVTGSIDLHVYRSMVNATPDGYTYILCSLVIC